MYTRGSHLQLQMHKVFVFTYTICISFIALRYTGFLTFVCPLCAVSSLNTQGLYSYVRYDPFIALHNRVLHSFHVREYGDLVT